MLVDVEFKRPYDFAMARILDVISDNYLMPTRIEKGLYQCGHWSIDQLIELPDPYNLDNPLPLEQGGFGVCDGPEQFKRAVDCDAFPDPVFVTFVQVKKEDQSPDGGWRWHKWGEYIGEHVPQCEYLYDEPDIEEAWTYAIHRAPEKTNGDEVPQASPASEAG